jgi:ATP-dependent helicase/nuclease subunit A
LQKLTGLMPDDADIARARQLFAHVLDTLGGVKIQTIHAFCQALLRRFPLEAGVPAEFAVMDERSARETLIEAGERVVIAAREGDDPELADALAVIARHAPEERFGALMAALTADRGKLHQALSRGPCVMRDRLCKALSLRAGASEETLVADF